MHVRKLTAALAAVPLVLASSVGIAMADEVSNNLDGSVDAAAETMSLTAGGDAGSTQLRILPAIGDGKNGCNLTGSTVLAIGLSSSNAGVATVSPASVTFTSCSDVKTLTVTPLSVGSTSISASEAGNTTGGSFDLAPATFTVNVATPAAPAPADTTKPVITPTVTGTLGQNGWYTSNVGLSWSVVDNESAVTSSTGCGTVSITEDQGATDYTCTATSAGGTETNTVSIKRDATLPSVNLVTEMEAGAQYYFGDVPAAPTCSASDTLPGSGLNGTCSVSGYSYAVGSHTVTATAADNAGNTATASRTYAVLPWTAKGFYSPVDMGNVWNTVRGGSTVPLKFELFAGTTELVNTSAVSGFKATAVACPGSSAAVDAIETLVTGGTSLRYDTTGGQFIQNWQTPKKPGTCATAVISLQDGSSISAYFLLK